MCYAQRHLSFCLHMCTCACVCLNGIHGLKEWKVRGLKTGPQWEAGSVYVHGCVCLCVCCGGTLYAWLMGDQPPWNSIRSWLQMRHAGSALALCHATPNPNTLSGAVWASSPVEQGYRNTWPIGYLQGAANLLAKLFSLTILQSVDGGNKPNQHGW